MREDRVWNFEAAGHQKSGPVDCMLAQDVFANQMNRRPELFKAGHALTLFVSKTDGGDVISQRVKPNIDRMRSVVRDRDGPTDGALLAADGKIGETGAHETTYFVTPRLGLNEVGALGIQLQQRFAVIRQTEEITLFRNPVERLQMHQTGWRFARL